MLMANQSNVKFVKDKYENSSLNTKRKSKLLFNLEYVK